MLPFFCNFTTFDERKARIYIPRRNIKIPGRIIARSFDPGIKFRTVSDLFDFRGKSGVRASEKRAR